MEPTSLGNRERLEEFVQARQATTKLRRITHVYIAEEQTETMGIHRNTRCTFPESVQC